MRKLFISITILLFCVALSGTGSAWKFNSHRDTVVKAFEFMESSHADYIQQWTANFLKYAGGSDIALKMGNKNGDTDNFYDTSIGGWWVGYRTHVGIFGFDTNFTSFWHFITMFRPGNYGNAYSGYSYKYSLEDGFWGLNGVIKSLLYNQDVRNSGNAGNNISYPTNGKGVKDAYKFRYQLSAGQKYYSTTSGGNYDDYQDIIFEPNSNASAYWYAKALEGRTPSNIGAAHLYYLGHVFHMVGDSNVTQHVWNTSDHNHVDYEGWVDDNRASLVNFARVKELVQEFKNAHGITSPDKLRNVTLQQITVFFATKAVNRPAPLYSKDYSVRVTNGAEEYNGSIAINVIVLEKYIYDLYLAESARKF
ncbi:MAG TPA: hypothetical protein PKM65_11005 [Spirochaetota bacterium]|nr:hypothetical protein [Spirochaetota bacterium]HNT09327.1 hypothetical protein [Spirochaetota bacterium]HNV45527.1 hypothetical protein [Spirochaetota bacterium]HPU87189.1 hypothetical protein [Spirochaetota bacterium]